MHVQPVCRGIQSAEEIRRHHLFQKLHSFCFWELQAMLLQKRDGIAQHLCYLHIKKSMGVDKGVNDIRHLTQFFGLSEDQQLPVLPFNAWHARTLTCPTLVRIGKKMANIACQCSSYIASGSSHPSKEGRQVRSSMLALIESTGLPSACKETNINYHLPLQDWTERRKLVSMLLVVIEQMNVSVDDWRADQ